MIIDKLKSVYDQERDRKQQIIENERQRQIAELNIARIKRHRQCMGMRNTAIGLIIFGGLCGLTLINGWDENHAYVLLGAALLAAAFVLLYIRNSRIRKWAMYEAAVRNHGNSSLDCISGIVGKPSGVVAAELQDMISKDFFKLPSYDTDAYIDSQRGLFVMTRNGEPMESIALTDMEREAREKKEAERAEAAARWDAESECIKAITITLNSVDDEATETVLRELEASIRRIEKRVSGNEAIKTRNDYKKLQTYFIPKVMSLLEKLREDQVSKEMQGKIRETMEICAGAFDELNNKLVEPEDINTEVDIELLKRELASEGLMGKDFDIK